jgi:hypothetical protein
MVAALGLALGLVLALCVPFARILLAIAYAREKDRTRALEVLTSPRAQFPGNTPFPWRLRV